MIAMEQYQNWNKYDFPFFSLANDDYWSKKGDIYRWKLCLSLIDQNLTD